MRLPRVLFEFGIWNPEFRIQNLKIYLPIKDEDNDGDKKPEEENMRKSIVEAGNNEIVEAVIATHPCEMRKILK